MSLAPCTSCARHVRRTEAACPFCGVALALERVVPMRVVSERLGRAAIFSLGAAAITNVVGCGARSDVLGPTAGHDAAQYDAGGAPSTHYGGPPVVTADAGPPVVTADAGPPAMTEDGGIDADLGCCSADYGAPPSP